MIQGTADDTVTLHDVEPELAARMMLWAYFGQYPIGLDSYCTHEAKTVNQTLEQGQTDKSKPFVPLWSSASEDAVMHLKMVCLAEKMGMQGLEKYSKKQLKQAFRWGGRDDFWKAVAARDGVSDVAAAKAEEVRGV